MTEWGEGELRRLVPGGEPSPEEIAALEAGLRRLADGGWGMPRLPFPVMAALHRLAPLPVVELCATDGAGGVLLTWRDDVHWRGWHFPGGFMAPGEGVADACGRIATRELGAGFNFEGVVGVECWPRHPFASPVALLCRGRLDGPPTEGQYFPAPPDDLIAEQRPYFQALADGAVLTVDRARA